MKKTFLLAACLCFYVFSQAQVQVGADKSFTKSLNDYSTFGWSTQIAHIPSDQIFVSPNGVLVFNNQSVWSKISNTICVANWVTYEIKENLWSNLIF